MQDERIHVMHMDVANVAERTDALERPFVRMTKPPYPRLPEVTFSPIRLSREGGNPS